MVVPMRAILLTLLRKIINRKGFPWQQDCIDTVELHRLAGDDVNINMIEYKCNQSSVFESFINTPFLGPVTKKFPINCKMVMANQDHYCINILLKRLTIQQSESELFQSFPWIHLPVLWEVTVTVKVHIAEFPASSVTVYVTWVFPNWKEAGGL